MKNRIKDILVFKENYNARSAEITATDLCSIKDPTIKAAVGIWVATGEQKNAKIGNLSSKQLMENHGMKYPASLIFLDWYIEKPQEAISCLEQKGGFFNDV